MENDLSKAYTEVLIILSHIEPKYLNMIPQKLLELFKAEQDKNYNPIIDVSISLLEQNLHRKTLALLAMLNLNYWCENENQKKELIALYAENDKRKEEELREKYNPDNLFNKNKQMFEDNEIKQRNTQLVEYKEQNIFKKILNKIMKFFKNNI